MRQRPITVMCMYRVSPPREREFLRLFKRHWPTLRGLSLVAATPRLAYRGLDETKQPFFVEIFAWRSTRSARSAHEHPEVAALWERMETLCEARGGRPALEFPHISPITVSSGPRR